MKLKTFHYNYRAVLRDNISHNTAHHKKTRELSGERDNARNNARCTQARKTTHGLDGQHQDMDRTLRRRFNQLEWQRTEINGESRPTTMVWPTLESRTAKGQNRTEPRSPIGGADNRQNCDYGYYYQCWCCCCCCICIWAGLERTISMWLTAVEFVGPVSAVVLAITHIECWYTQTGGETRKLLSVITTCCNDKTSTRNRTNCGVSPLYPRSIIAKVCYSQSLSWRRLTFRVRVMVSVSVRVSVWL